MLIYQHSFSFQINSRNQKIGDKNKTYDNEFIDSLAKGLNNRWGIVDLNEKNKGKDKITIKDYRDYIDCELIEIDKYNNRNFKDPKLIVNLTLDLRMVQQRPRL